MTSLLADPKVTEAFAHVDASKRNALRSVLDNDGNFGRGDKSADLTTLRLAADCLNEVAGAGRSDALDEDDRWAYSGLARALPDEIRHFVERSIEFFRLFELEPGLVERFEETVDSTRLAVHGCMEALGIDWLHYPLPNFKEGTRAIDRLAKWHLGVFLASPVELQPEELLTAISACESHGLMYASYWKPQFGEAYGDLAFALGEPGTAEIGYQAAAHNSNSTGVEGRNRAKQLCTSLLSNNHPKGKRFASLTGDRDTGDMFIIQYGQEAIGGKAFGEAVQNAFRVLPTLDPVKCAKKAHREWQKTIGPEFAAVSLDR